MAKTEQRMGNEKLRVLLIEDSPTCAALARAQLAQAGGDSFEVTLADSLAQGLERLSAGGVDAVLLDLTLPDSWGLDTFLRVHRHSPQVPVVVMSGVDDEELALRTVQEGAQDYLVKGRDDGNLLVRGIRYGVERNRLRQELDRERNLLRTLLDNVPDRIYFKDRQSRFLLASRAMARLFHLDNPDQALGKTDFDFFTAEHARPAFEDEQRILQSGEPVLDKVEKETFAGGRTLWALTSKLPLRDKDGAIVGTFGISKDITSLKLLEEELADERTFLRAVIDAVPDQIYVKDKLGRFTDANRATALSLAVASADELVGRSDVDFFPAEAAAAFAAEEHAILEGILPKLQRETPMAFKDGITRWMATTKVPLRDSQGRIIGLVGINRDITERKRSEEQLQDMNFDLARSQNELLQVLDDLKKSHGELKAAQMQLIEAEKLESVGRIAAGVAHEVKNPLAILLMGIDYLAGEPCGADPGMAMVLQDMRDAVHRGDAIVRGLLDFSTVRKLDLEANDLNAIIEKSLLLVRHELVKANLTVMRQLGDRLPPVSLDFIKMQQVFVNLFMNAIHAMKPAGTLTVTTRSRTVTEVEHNPGERDADRLRVGELIVEAVVDDTGHGIAGDKITKVFDPFFTTKPTGSGTGLGLTVVKKIIELHRGQIQIMNRPEGGARVVVTLRATGGL